MHVVDDIGDAAPSTMKRRLHRSRRRPLAQRWARKPPARLSGPGFSCQRTVFPILRPSFTVRRIAFPTGNASPPPLNANVPRSPGSVVCFFRTVSSSFADVPCSPLDEVDGEYAVPAPSVMCIPFNASFRRGGTPHIRWGTRHSSLLSRAERRGIRNSPWGMRSRKALRRPFSRLLKPFAGDCSQAVHLGRLDKLTASRPSYAQQDSQSPSRRQGLRARRFFDN